MGKQRQLLLQPTKKTPKVSVLVSFIKFNCLIISSNISKFNRISNQLSKFTKLIKKSIKPTSFPKTFDPAMKKFLVWWWWGDSGGGHTAFKRDSQGLLVAEDYF